MLLQTTAPAYRLQTALMRLSLDSSLRWDVSAKFLRVMFGVGEAKTFLAINLQPLYVVHVVVQRMTMLLFVYQFSCRVSSVTHPYAAMC